MTNATYFLSDEFVSSEKVSFEMVDDMGRNALMLAAGKGDTAKLYTLIFSCHAGTLKNTLKKTDHMGLTALMHAALSGSVETVKALVDVGADIYFENDHHQSALSVAQGWDCRRVVAYLSELMECRFKEKRASLIHKKYW